MPLHQLPVSEPRSFGMVPKLFEKRCRLAHQLLPSLVGCRTRLHDTAPSLHLFVADFIATTSGPAPCPRLRTFVLMVLPLVTFPFASQAKVHTFHISASRQAHATSMPDAAQPVYRHRLSFSRRRFA